jgi:hypothetical protein
MPYKFKITWSISFTTKHLKGLTFEDTLSFVNLTQANRYAKSLQLNSVNSNIVITQLCD